MNKFDPNGFGLDIGPQKLNKQVSWDDFNAKAYRMHYFGEEVEAEDLWGMLQTAHFLNENVRPHSIEEGVDVGTGSSLILPSAGVPYIKHYDMLDPGSQNVGYLRHVLGSKDSMETDWGTTVRHLQTVNDGRYRNTVRLLMKRAEVHQCYAQDYLQDKAGQYGAVTMGFCAGSNSTSREETANFMGIVLDALKPGGFYAALHTLNSGPYPDRSTEPDGSVNMSKFPSTNVDMDWYEEQYRKTNIQLYESPITQMRPGYSGTLLALGFK